MGDHLTKDAYEDPADDTPDSTTVLELFGVKLKVRNQRLAEVLMMDAREALGAEHKQPSDAAAVRAQAAEAAEALPDVILNPPTPHFEDEMRHRAEMRQRVSALGAALGFEVEPDGSWNSPTGIQLLTRVVEDQLTPVAATDAVSKVGTPVVLDSGLTSTVLFVSADRSGAEAIGNAIRERSVYDHARVISLEDLEFVRSLCTARVLDHRGVLVLLTPVADADVGDLLGIVRSAAG